MPKQATKTLTTKAVQNAKRPASGYREIPDGLIGGLALRISASGRKSFILSHRPNGKLRRKALGTFPNLSLADARTRAAELKDNPAKWTEHARPSRSAITFGDVAAEYLKREKDKLVRGWEIEQIINRELNPHWRDVAMVDLRRRDAYERTDALVDAGKPMAAHRLHEIIRRIGRWAIQRDLIDVNGFAGMEPPVAKVPRDRVLTPDEIAAVWKAWDAQAYPFGHFGKMLLLTAQRLSKVAGMRWSEIDRDANLWTIPGARTKNNLEARVPLSAMALEVLDSVPRFEGRDLVFSTKWSKWSRPISGFHHAKTASDIKSGVTGWRFHDLRRTARTGLAELGVPEVVAERVLNHAERNVLARTYNRHEYAAEKADALERWGQRVRQIVGRAS